MPKTAVGFSEYLPLQTCGVWTEGLFFLAYMRVCVHTHTLRQTKGAGGEVGGEGYYSDSMFKHRKL